MDKPNPDWEKIELEYRAGVKSLREIALGHEITEGAIRKRAKRDGWDRDLTAKIKLKTESLVRKEMVRNEVRNSPQRVLDEREIVDVSAQMQASVILSHRKDVCRYNALAIKLLSEIETETDNPVPFEELAEMIIWKSGDDGEVQTKAEVDRLNRMQSLFDRVMSNPTRVDSLKKLVDIKKTLIALERQAIGLKDDDIGKSDGGPVRVISAEISAQDAARAYAELMALPQKK